MTRGPIPARARWLLAIFAIALGALSYDRLVRSRDSEPILLRLEGAALGTTYAIAAIAPLGRRDELAAAATVELMRVDALMSTYRPDSELSRLNAHRESAPFPISEPLREVIEAARAVSEQSAGAFDITTRPLVALWGFGDATPKKATPSLEAIALAKERVGHGKLRLIPGAIEKARPDVECDLSALAKGYAVDRVSAALAELGADRHLVEVGGELRARGTRLDGTPWRVGIERPDGSRTVHLALTLPGGSGMATSGDYRNHYELEGVRVSHTLDPRTGHPIAHALASVTVVHEDAMRADAWATALNVLGPSEGPELARRLGLASAFITRGARGDFELEYTPAFEALLASKSPPHP